MMTKTVKASLVAVELPKIKRAKDFFLYTEDGRRLIDLWQGGGTAVLGHSPPGLLSAVKNSASRGLYYPLPSAWQSRLTRSLGRLFPAYQAAFDYSDPVLTRSALAELPDPAFRDISAGADQAIWRPWAPFPALEASDAPTKLFPILPLPFGGLFCRLLLKTDPGQLPPSQLSPVLAAAACRACDNLWLDLQPVALKKPNSPQRTRQTRKITDAVYPRQAAAKAACLRALENGKSPWQRRGIYLSFRQKSQLAYSQVFQNFLAAGFLLPPSPDEPAILPAELSPGSDAALAVLLAGS